MGDEQYKQKALNETCRSSTDQIAQTKDLDQLMRRRASKIPNKTKVLRKRSLSLDDDTLHLPSKLSRLSKTPTKSPKTPIFRTKLPNFAAIHEKQFKKMENLVDYVARKTERAQHLTNSASNSQKGLLAKSSKKVKPEVGEIVTSLTNDKLIERREQFIAVEKSHDDLRADKKLKNNKIINGVRSNRNFELLMRHRKMVGN